jgi:hypothetical protein
MRSGCYIHMLNNLNFLIELGTFYIYINKVEEEVKINKTHT